MKRSPLKRTGPLERNTPLARKTPLKPVSPARRKKRFRAGFGSRERVRFVQALPCAVCGRVPSENAHVKSRGAGGGPEDVAPLCRAHHREQHAIGVESFEAKHGIILQDEARRTDARWEEHQREGGVRWLTRSSATGPRKRGSALCAC